MVPTEPEIGDVYERVRTATAAEQSTGANHAADSARHPVKPPG